MEAGVLFGEGAGPLREEFGVVLATTCTSDGPVYVPGKAQVLAGVHVPGRLGSGRRGDGSEEEELVGPR